MEITKLKYSYTCFVITLHIATALSIIINMCALFDGISFSKSHTLGFYWKGNHAHT